MGGNPVSVLLPMDVRLCKGILFTFLLYLHITQTLSAILKWGKKKKTNETERLVRPEE